MAIDAAPLEREAFAGAPALRDRVERALRAALARAAGPRAPGGACDVGPCAPPRLGAALEYAVFPGGGRVRPELAMVAAAACGDLDPLAADAAAASIELVHCASLVHDDLPCFDDAPTRRGRASLHKAFGQALALLAGDALIVLAFEVLGAVRGEKIAPLLAELCVATGAARGVIAGQAWESEPAAPLDEYHRAKTGSLFAAAGAMGAIAGGGAPAPWRRFGEAVGRAYQAADDLRDAAGDSDSLGKPTGRDAALGRPSLVRPHGVLAARARLMELRSAAFAAAPPGAGRAHARAWLERLSATVFVV